MQQFSLAFSGFPCFLCCKISRKSLVIQTNIHPLLATHTLFYISPAGSLTPCRIHSFPQDAKYQVQVFLRLVGYFQLHGQSLNLGIHPVTFFRNDIVAAAVLVARRSFSRSQQSTSISFFISGFFRFLLGFVGFFTVCTVVSSSDLCPGSDCWRSIPGSAVASYFSKFIISSAILSI